MKNMTPKPDAKTLQPLLVAGSALTFLGLIVIATGSPIGGAVLIVLSVIVFGLYGTILYNS